MAMKTIRAWFKGGVERRSEESQPMRDWEVILISPVHDEVTEAMAKWPLEWSSFYDRVISGREVTSSRGAALLGKGTGARRILLFLGHGFTEGLCTHRDDGKKDVQVGDEFYGCWLDVDDLSNDTDGLHVVAWSCLTGKKFGALQGQLNGCGFLGFCGPTGILFGDRRSEALWSNVVRQTFESIVCSGGINPGADDKLKNLLGETRRTLGRGGFDTGKYNIANRLLLGLNRRHVCAHSHGG